MSQDRLADHSALFLDDSASRIGWIEHIWRGELSIVITAKTCIEKLKEKKFDILFLDHDLGGQVYTKSDIENCGMEVVRWLENNHLPHLFIHVHTWNTPAGKEMKQRLERAGYVVEYIPFDREMFMHYL